MRERRRENWSHIEKEGEKYKGTIIVGGDFNARTAEEGGKLSEQDTVRISKDKIKNREGEEMIEKIREIGMHIINGGTVDKGDEEFTYIGGGGKSTIDYVVTNEEGEEIIEEMEVGTNTESDHQPLIVRINKKYSRQAEKQRETIMDWSESAVVEFKKRLAEGAKNGDWTEIKMKIQKAIQWREVSRDVKKKEKWWDKTCHGRKIQLKEKLRKCKRGNLEMEEYRKERKAYRSWLEKKKSEWNEKILEEVEKDKSEKSFWKVVNEGRKERT